MGLQKQTGWVMSPQDNVEQGALQDSDCDIWKNGNPWQIQSKSVTWADISDDWWI